MGSSTATWYSDAGQPKVVGHDLRRPLAALGALITSTQQHEDLPNGARGCLAQMEAQVRDLAALCGTAALDLEASPPSSGGSPAQAGSLSRTAVGAGADEPCASRTGHLSVVICDGHRMFGDCLGSVLEGRGHRVVACTSDPSVAVAEVAGRRPDILVTELQFPEADGVDVLDASLGASPATRAIVLSGAGSPEGFARARAAGAAACLVKHGDMGRILEAFDAVAAGDQVFDQPPERPTRDGGEDEDLLRFLTGRERQVLERLVRGQRTTTIAVEMGMAHSTARSHIQKVLLKLGAHSRLEAVSLVTAAPGRKARTTAIG